MAVYMQTKNQPQIPWTSAITNDNASDARLTETSHANANRQMSYSQIKCTSLEGTRYSILADHQQFFLDHYAKIRVEANNRKVRERTSAVSYTETMEIVSLCF